MITKTNIRSGWLAGAALFITLSLLFVSCSDSFLDTQSKTDSSTGNYYKSQADVARALIGCYDGWQGTVSKGPTFAFHYASELLADNCFGGTGTNDARNAQVIDRFDINQDPSQTNLFYNLWQYYYQGLYNVNELLAMEPGVAWSSESLHGQYIGEARAMRAIMYFDLVRMFENVPLVTVPTIDVVPQADPDSTYALIIGDLKYAAENIPSDAYPKANAAENDGRITRYAAKALLARVYLFYTGVYGKEPKGLTKAEALQGLEDIIASNEYALVPEFKNLWPAASDNWVEDETGGWRNDSTYAGNGNAETVLSMKFNYTSDYNGNSGGNNAIQMFGIRGGTFKAPYGQGWGGCTVSKKTVASFASGDQRRAASIVDLVSEGIADMTEYQKALSDQREYTGYTVKKYTPRSGYLQNSDGTWTLTHRYNGLMAGDFQISQPQDYVLIRYADVLLMAAELGSTNAQTYFDQVRQRAYTERIDENGAPVVSGYYRQKSVSQENIMEERRLEFAFEGLRYWDLLRQGIDVAANAIAQSGETTFTGGNEDAISISADNIRTKRGFLQIPLTAIQLSNGLYKQNVGW